MSERLWEFLRWGVKSGVGLGMNLVLLTVWVDRFQIPAEVAIFINWLLLSVYGYVVTHRWVFDETKSLSGIREHTRQWLGMQGILAGGKAVNYVVYVVLLQAIDYRLAWVLGAVVGLAVSFGGNRTWWVSQSRT